MSARTSNSASMPQPSRAETAARELREKIVRGKLAPGDQLPSWDELEQLYGVPRTTLNRIFVALKQDGFVYSDSTRGTFVTARPPHLSRYALAFWQRPGDPGWNRFWWSIDNQAVVLQQNGAREFPRFYGLSANSDNESHIQLLSDLDRRRVAGVLVVGHLQMLSPQVWAHEDVPKVQIATEVETSRSGTPAVLVDRQSFIDRSMDYLLARGRKRVAVITTPPEPLHGFTDAAAKRGMYQPAHWRLSASVEYAQTARPMVQLLMSLPKEQRPDALVIADDNLVENVVAALMSSGVRMPDELEVVAHCAWPQTSATQLPMRRLGYDVGRILSKAIDLIDAQRRGESVPAHSYVSAIFDDEL